MPNRFAFHGGSSGCWRVAAQRAVVGEPLAAVSHLDVRPADKIVTGAAWILEGLMSNLRYATRQEVTTLRTRQEDLGRPAARLAACIPIKKSSAWWALAQDERRQIFEEQSHHTAIGLDYLPAVARQLYHCRDIEEPFDFVTWFEFPPEAAAAFDDLLAKLRATREWTYVEREVELRLERL